MILLGVTHFFVRPSAGMPKDAVSTGLTCAVMEAMHRRITLDRRVFIPAAGSLCAMVAAWIFLPASLGIGPELVCWLGAAIALVGNRRLGEKLVRHGIEAEAVFFLLSLFVMVVAVRDTGLFEVVAKSLEQLPISPTGQLVVFLLLAGVLTGLFSAGPSMAALLEVAESLAKRLPPSAVYVGLALSVCAGSSLFLTAATSGPLAQALTERADLRDIDEKPIRFGFFEFLPAGLVGFAIIEATALGYAAWVLS